jgi:hypothetical protein
VVNDGSSGITKPKQRKEKKKKENGKSKDKRSAAIDLDIVEKSQMEKDMEIIQGNIIKYQKQIREALTKEEKDCIDFRIKSLEQNQIRMLKKFEQRFHKEPYIMIDDKSTPPLSEITKQYPDLQYDVDDPIVKSRIGRGLSYNSGYSGYTQKEACELVKLLDMID